MKQTTAVLFMLRTHSDGITAMDALREIGCMRLAGRINDLRNDGHRIDTELVEVPVRGGGNARVARYKLGKEA